PRRQRFVLQVVDELAGVGAVTPELDQFLDCISGRRRVAERGVRVEQGLRRGQLAEVRDRVFEPFAFGPGAMLAEECQLGIEGFLAASSRSGDPDRLDEPVVLAEADKHAHQNPGDRGLGDPVVTPLRPGPSRAFLFSCLAVGPLPLLVQSRVLVYPSAEVVFHCDDLLLQVLSERLVGGHRSPSGAAARAWAPIQSGSSFMNWPGAANGRGRRSITAPRVPASCGTSTQMACGRRVPRSAHGPRMFRWPYRASGATSVSSTGRVPSGASLAAAVIAASTAGRLRLTSVASPSASRVPAEAASASWTNPQSKPNLAACAFIASISTWVTSTTLAPNRPVSAWTARSARTASTPMARNDLVAVLSVSRCPDGPSERICRLTGPSTVAGRESRPRVADARVRAR